MRITVCELPHDPDGVAAAWPALCAHTAAHRSELVVLPEAPMVVPLWEQERYHQGRWRSAETLSALRLRRLGDLRAAFVIGTRPVRVARRRLNQAFLWTADVGLSALRSKWYLPNEERSWEARWFHRGDATFPVFRAGLATFGVNICSELWATETYGAYADAGAHLVVAPRATARGTAAKWLALGISGAVRAGAFGVSSNHVSSDGAYGGGGWIIDPDGDVLATTSTAEPFVTRDVDLRRAVKAKRTYPRYVFSRTS